MASNRPRVSLKLVVMLGVLAAATLYAWFLLISPAFLPNDSVVCDAHIMHPGDVCHTSGGRGRTLVNDFEEQHARNVRLAIVILGLDAFLAATFGVMWFIVKYLVDSDHAAPDSATVPVARVPNHALPQPHYVQQQAHHGYQHRYDVPPPHRPPPHGRYR